MIRRLAFFSITWRRPLFLVGVVAVLAAYAPAQRLEFDRSIESMFSRHDPVLPPFEQLGRTFHSDEIAVAAYRDPNLLTSAGLDRLEELATALSQVDGVAHVLSLSQARFLLAVPPLAERYLQLSEGFLVGADRQTAAVACVLAPRTPTSRPRSETVEGMKRVIDQLARGGVLTGEPVMLVDGFRAIDDDAVRLGRMATVLLLVVIALSFRSIRWMVAPMVMVYATWTLTRAVLALGAYRLSMVSSMLWAIVTVVAVATVVHVIVGFREARASGLAPAEALAETMRNLAVPIFWTCLTDAAGFASLMASSVGPVQDFGAMMTLGSLMVLPAMFLLLPGLALFGTWGIDPRRAWGEARLDRGLDGLLQRIERHARSVALVMISVASAAAIGAGWLVVETDFTKNFRASSPIVKAYDFVETRLGGAGVWDVIVPVPDATDPECFARLRRVEKRLREEVRVPAGEGRPDARLTKVVSVVDVFDVAGLSLAIEPQQLEAALKPLENQFALAGFLHGRDPQSPDRLLLRIMLRSSERQPASVKQQLIAEVNRICRDEFPEAEVTGYFVLLARLIDSVLRDQWLTFSLALSGIAVMMTIAFRSLRLALVALVPNVLPILLVLGSLGWMGFHVNMGVAMIASVSIGLSVDSSIHYIIAYQRRRAAGMGRIAALEAAHHTVGRAIVFSTLALMVGFTALCLSRFIPTIYFGTLVSLSMLGGLVGNLVLLPILLTLVSPGEG